MARAHMLYVAVLPLNRKNSGKVYPVYQTLKDRGPFCIKPPLHLTVYSDPNNIQELLRKYRNLIRGMLKSCKIMLNSCLSHANSLVSD